jgi:acetylornithine/succinyldiaminopimelate/putrescine aminotransferase
VPIGAVLSATDCYTEEFALNHPSTFAGNAPCRIGNAVWTC